MLMRTKKRKKGGTVLGSFHPSRGFKGKKVMTEKGSETRRAKVEIRDWFKEGISTT